MTCIVYTAKFLRKLLDATLHVILFLDEFRYRISILTLAKSSGQKKAIKT